MPILKNILFYINCYSFITSKLGRAFYISIARSAFMPPSFIISIPTTPLVVFFFLLLSSSSFTAPLSLSSLLSQNQFFINYQSSFLSNYLICWCCFIVIPHLSFYIAGKQLPTDADISLEFRERKERERAVREREKQRGKGRKARGNLGIQSTIYPSHLCVKARRRND